MRKALRQLTLGLVFSLSGLGAAIAQPYTILNTTFTNQLNCVKIAPNGTVYVGGRDGLLARSTDQGNTWTSLTLPSGVSATDSVNNILLLNNDSIRVFTNRKMISSNDGWQTTQVTRLPIYGLARRVVAINASRLWLSQNLEPSGLFRSQNGGLTWDSVALAPNSIATFIGHKFADSRVGAAVGGNFRNGTRDNSVFITKNGGLTWDSVQTFPRGLAAVNQQWDVYFKSASTLMVVGAKDMMSVSTDTGATWTSLNQNDNSQPYLRTLAGRGDTILTFGDDGYARSGYYSKDFGANKTQLASAWATTRSLTGNARRVVDVDYLNRTGYFVAGGGTVIKLTAASMGFIVALPNSFLREGINVYPNPVNSSRQLKMAGWRSATEVRFTVYNAMGQSVFTSAVTPDGGNLTLSLQSLQPGQYHLEAIQQNQRYNQQLVIE